MIQYLFLQFQINANFAEHAKFGLLGGAGGVCVCKSVTFSFVVMYMINYSLVQYFV